MRTQPLVVHLVFHPDSTLARGLAREVHKALNDDPACPSLCIPTVFCAESPDKEPPTDQGLDQAALSFVVPLADTKMNISSSWCSFVADLWEQCRDSGHRCVPVQLTEDAWPLEPDRLGGVNFVRAFDVREEQFASFVVRRIIIELNRYLHGDRAAGDSADVPTKVFISHTKMDIDKSPQVVQYLKEYLLGDQPIKTWFDSGDIGGGSRFADEIAQGVEDSSLVCVVTDNYGSREWCRKEVLLAKFKQRPIVVIDAISDKEVRSFPYLGNLPLIRWNNNAEAVIDLLLKETLRDLHTRALLERQREPDDVVFSRPPELLTLIHCKAGDTVLYTEPPLGGEEKTELAKMGITVTTPLERLTATRPLKGRCVALSMSESTDITKYGADSLHIEAAILELSRYLLVQGATLVYGGHLGAAGYTAKLFELVRAHNMLAGVEPVDRVVNYIGWPLSVSELMLAEHKYVARLKSIPRPQGIDEILDPDFAETPEFFPAEKSPKHRYAWARGMSAMREQETEETVARIVLGGTFGATKKVGADGETAEKWYASRIPGVLEEVVLSVMAEEPVFLIGAYGGVAALVIDILAGVDRPEMTWAYQKGAPHAEEMRKLYEQRGDTWMDYPEMVDLLRSKGISGINSLLNEDSHKRLFVTRDPLEMAEIIIRGLGKLP